MNTTPPKILAPITAGNSQSGLGVVDIIGGAAVLVLVVEVGGSVTFTRSVMFDNKMYGKSFNGVIVPRRGTLGTPTG